LPLSEDFFVMTRAARTWLIFALSAGLAAAAMGWISYLALRLEGAESTARLRAEREERVRLALWRMELAVAPILAREGSRPYFAYSSFYPAERAYTRMLAEVRNGEVFMPSPLLTANDPMVRLHFQIDPAGGITSPEAPCGQARKMALNDGFIEAAQLAVAAGRTADLGKFLNRQELLAGLPSEVQRHPVMIAQKSGGGQPPAQVWGPGQQRGQVDLAMVENAAGQQGANLQDVQELAGQQQAWNPKQVLAQSEQRNKYLSSKEYQARSQSVQRQQVDDNTAANTTMGNWFNNPGSLSSSPNSSGSSLGKPGKVSVVPYDQQQKPPSSGKEPPNQQGKPVAGKPEAQPQSAADALAGINDSPLAEVIAGEMRPVWLGGELVLARRISVDSQPYVQGCWLNWPELRRVLLDDVKDLLPGAGLEPVKGSTVADDERMLAALPLRLLPGPEESAGAAGSSTVRLWLYAAWGGMGLAALAVALLLGGTLALSERRAAFVSAVTHELRSPLTTFRMYAEMLHEGMVPDEARRRKYLATLRAEAGRLGHLVENVLAYARLENSRRTSRIETLTVAALLERVVPRLAERAAGAGMELVVADGKLPVASCQLSEAANGRQAASTGNWQLATGNCCSVRADPAAVEQILFNLVDNACKYAASAQDKRIHLDAARSGGRALIAVRDHGPGVNPDVVGRMFRPFSRSAADAAGSAPGVGLGLALSRRLARGMGGELRREAGHGAGAGFVLELPLG
jgi:signal transduction histidine kinase